MTTTNPTQAEMWNGPSGESWVAMQEHMDVQLHSLGQAVMAELALQRGERVLDIGCGAGTTTQQLAAVVGDANVVGVDISRPLVEHARRRAPAIRFELADAGTAQLGTFDAIFSRFGVMFFSDPVAAFTNLASMLRPGGRVGFVCWRPVDDNPVMTVPMAAAVAAGLPAPPPPDDPFAPGPFAFADKGRLAGILSHAGFSSILIEPHDERIGGNDPATTLEVSLRIGPLGRLLREQPQYRDVAIAAVKSALVSYTENNRVLMPSATWIVTAKKR